MHTMNHDVTTESRSIQLINNLRANLPTDVSTLIQHNQSSNQVIHEWRNARLTQIKRTIVIEAASKIIKETIEQYPHLSLRLDAHRVSHNRTVDQSDLQEWITMKSLQAHQNGAQHIEHERALLASNIRESLKHQLSSLQSIILHNENNSISSPSSLSDQQLFDTPTNESTLNTLLGQSASNPTHRLPNLQLIDQRLKLINANDIVINSSIAPEVSRLQLASSWLGAKVDCLELKLSLQKIAASLSAESVQHTLPSQTKEAASILARQKLTAALNERHALLETEIADIKSTIDRIRHVRTSSAEWNECNKKWQEVKQVKLQKAWTLQQIQKE